MTSVVNLRRSHTGVGALCPKNSDFHIIRSLTVNDDGKVKFDDFINEIFYGILHINTNDIEYFGHPSTILLDNSSVIMASQVYEKEFTNHKNFYSELLNNKNPSTKSYTDYFHKRQEFYKKNKDVKKIVTWLGAPSIIFNYKNRNIIQTTIGETCLNMMFWLTSFSSTSCIVGSKLQDIPYCERFEKLKETCKPFQKHETFSEFGSKEKFITSFEESIKAIKNEDTAIDKINYGKELNEKYFQRYNELLTYFFPWDIDGIEIGNSGEEIVKEIIKTIYEERQKIILELQEFLNNENLLNLLQEHVNLIKQNLLKEEKDNVLFLLAKFILICDCEYIILHKNETLLSKNETNIIKLINKLIEILKTDLKIYEYSKKEDNSNKFTMNCKGVYQDESSIDLLKRESDFFLLEQVMHKKNETESIHTTQLSKLQLQYIEEIIVGGKRNKYKKNKKNLKTKKNLNSKIKLKTNSKLKSNSKSKLKTNN